ncbi:MAG: hypothetical protein AB1333_01175 [Patescibacteria group bacterium]
MKNGKKLTQYNITYTGTLKKIKNTKPQKFSIRWGEGYEHIIDENGEIIKKMRLGNVPILLEDISILDQKMFESLPNGTTVKYYESGKRIMIGKKVIELEKSVHVKVTE